MKNIGLKQSGINDEISTPEEAIYPLLKILKRNWIIWECCWGDGDLAKHLRKFGFKVVGDPDEDFFTSKRDCDIIITNPPYSNKRDFIQRAIELRKPFAFLVPITTLEGKKSMELFHDKDIQIIIPNKRINFIKEKSGSWFAVMWLTCGLNLRKSINYFDMDSFEAPKIEDIDSKSWEIILYCRKCGKEYKFIHKAKYFHPWEITCPECNSEKIFFRRFSV